MSNAKVVKTLEKALADTYTLYLKTQNYHWNVTGPQFNSLHTLFETQYTDLAAANDEIAERIRALGHKAPGSFAEFAKLASLKEGDKDASASVMLKQLRDDNEKITATLKAALAQAQQEGDEVTADLMIGRITIHDKNAWMLGAMLEK